MHHIKIKENTLIARIAAFLLKKHRIATVINSTIFLYNASSEELTTNKKWLLHELKHVEQFRRYGTVRFLFLYLIESVRVGYSNNKFEVEARNAESDESLLGEYIIR